MMALFLTNVYCIRRVKRFFIGLITFIIFLLFNILFVKPVRNFLFQPFWPNAWRPVNTLDILVMRNIDYPSNVTDLTSCNVNFKSKYTFDTVDQNAMLKYKDATINNSFFQNEIYAGFLPTITWKERVETVLLLRVFAEVLDRIKVSYFFAGGSLLGVFRHGGPIPWDTDIDLAVNGSQWKEVRTALSCLDGYELRTKWHMHWKFHFKGRHFPFIDVFFFAENEQYIYAMNYYTLNSILYPKSSVVPLQMAMFDGIRVPVPNDVEYCVRIEFDAEYCYPPSTNHKTGKHYKKTLVKCSDMQDYYPIQNLKF